LSAWPADDEHAPGAGEGQQAAFVLEQNDAGLGGLAADRAMRGEVDRLAFADRVVDQSLGEHRVQHAAGHAVDLRLGDLARGERGLELVGGEPVGALQAEARFLVEPGIDRRHRGVDRAPVGQHVARPVPFAAQHLGSAGTGSRRRRDR
jgi:hypothetical protein